MEFYTLIVFFPASCHNKLCILLCLATICDLHIHQIDAKVAVLFGLLHEEMCCNMNAMSTKTTKEEEIKFPLGG